MKVLENKRFSVLVEHTQSTWSKNWLISLFQGAGRCLHLVLCIQPEVTFVFETLRIQTIYTLMCSGIQVFALLSFPFQIIRSIFRLHIFLVSLFKPLMHFLQAYYTVPNLFGFLYYLKSQWLKYLYLCQLLFPKSDKKK